MIGNFLGYFEKPHSYVKTAMDTFWATVGKVGLVFTPTSGHTGYDKNYGVFSQSIYDDFRYVNFSRSNVDVGADFNIRDGIFRVPVSG